MGQQVGVEYDPSQPLFQLKFLGLPVQDTEEEDEADEELDGDENDVEVPKYIQRIAEKRKIDQLADFGTAEEDWGRELLEGEAVVGAVPGLDEVEDVEEAQYNRKHAHKLKHLMRNHPNHAKSYRIVRYFRIFVVVRELHLNRHPTRHIIYN